MGEIDSISGYDQHMTVVGDPTATSGIENTVDLKLYFERSVTNSTWHSPNESYVFTKLCRIIIAGTIKDTAHMWRGTHVIRGNSIFSFRDQVLSGVLNSWIRADINDIPLSRMRISEKQQDVIDRAINDFFRININQPTDKTGRT